LAVLCASPVFSQSGPGLPNQEFPPSELFTIISSFGQNSYGHSLLHDGYVASLRSGAGVQFYDFSDPYNPQLVSSYSGAVNGMDLVEPHTYAQTDAWGGKHVVLMRGPGSLGGTGFVISDWGDVFNPLLESKYDIPGVPGGYASGVFWISVQAPYIYVPVGSLGLAIVNATDPQNPFVVNQVSKAQLGGFNAVVAFVVGNTLILTNSDSGSGFARLDVSDPVNPVLINSIPGPIIPYGAQVNGGKLIVPAVSGCAACPTGGNGSFHIHDLFASGFPVIGQSSLPSRGGSAVVQDQFVHIAASTHYIKLDVSNNSNYVTVGSTLQPFSGGDWDWVSPMGNFAILGDDQGQRTHVIPHQSAPDTTGPAVTMVDPPDGATDLGTSSRVGITTSDMIDMDSIDASSFIVRPVGGQAVPGSYSNQLGIVNFFPDAALQTNTTYEVVVPAGGMKDWVGNGMEEAFISRFTTGSAGGGGFVFVAAQPNPPAQVDLPVGFSAVANGQGPFQYSWDFGDGTPPTPFSSSGEALHTYTRGGHFSVLCTATNGSAMDTDSFVQTVHYPLTRDRPTHSSTIALNATNRTFCVNADNDTVTSIQRVSFVKLQEIAVGDHPRTVAFAPDGSAWVVCQGDATIHVIDPFTNDTLDVIQLPYASAPYGLAMSPDGNAAYVTLTAKGQVAKLDPMTRQWVANAAVGPAPKGIAVSADSQRIFVTRFISSSKPVSLSDDEFQPKPAGEVYELAATPFKKVRSLYLRFDPGPDTEASGRGLPNYLSSLTISPDGRRLWVPSKKDNTARGLFRSEETLNFESTVRTISSQIDLVANRERLGERIDFNDRDMAFAVVMPEMGDYAFHAIQGSNAIEVRDAFTGDLAADIPATGLAPQGLALENNQRLWVHNFMSRTVTVYDVSGVIFSTSFAMNKIATVSTVANEALSPQVLQGKRIFYNAEDPRMNEDGYLSCASCHLDGGQDGRTWDFTQRGEGLRNTITLEGRAGMGHGNVHWTANFDEIQDFENDIRAAFGGDGFMSSAVFNSGTVANPLGQPKAGLSPELDALAAYVASLDGFGKSPYRTPEGALSPGGQRGKSVFEQANCAQCHSGANFTDSRIHDVGTIAPGSGAAIGGPLLGLDTPTLRGLWKTAPYLHNGAAATLFDVIGAFNPTGQHGPTTTLTPQQREDLVLYLLQIDDLEPAAQ
jgi:cytochrome c peroxidase/streptogramin lyase